MRCTETTEAGAYVLGALSPAERSAYERHLKTCAVCRKEVADFAGLPGLLGRLDAKSAIGLTEAPKAPPMLETVLDRARAERQRARRRTVRRRTGMALAACVLALLAGLGVGAVTGTAGGAHRATVVTMAPVAKDTHLAAMLGYWQAQDGGTEISVACVYSGTAEPYNSRDHFDLWVVPRDGGPGRTVSGWDAGPGDRVTIWMEAPLRPDQIARMEIRSGTTTVLVYTL
jgi:anti-sigma-K factor RskA